MRQILGTNHDPSDQEAEAGGSPVRGQLGPHSTTLLKVGGGQGDAQSVSACHESMEV